MKSFIAIGAASFFFFLYLFPDQTRPFVLAMGCSWLIGSLILVAIEVARLLTGNQKEETWTSLSWVLLTAALCSSIRLAFYQYGAFWFRFVWALLAFYLFLYAFLYKRNKPFVS